MKGRAESYGHVKKMQNEEEAPITEVDCMYMHSEQEEEEEEEEEEEKGMSTIVAKNNETKMIMARVVPRKGVESYAVETVKKMADRLRYRRRIISRDSEPAILHCQRR